MNGYLVAIIGIAILFAAIITISIVVGVIKGFRAGETAVEIRIAGIIHFSIRLSDISGKKSNNVELNEKASGFSPNKPKT